MPIGSSVILYSYINIASDSTMMPLHKDHMSQVTAFHTSLSCPSEDADQPSHLCSLISIFAEHSVGSQRFKASSSGQQRFRSSCTDADPSLYWMHMQFCRKCCALVHIILNVISLGHITGLLPSKQVVY